MSTAKHTPGPWMCEESDGNLAKVTVTRNGLRSVIARLHDNSLCNEHLGSSSANANLIAAAPAMYEALQDIENFAELGLNSGKPEHLAAALADIMQTGREALAQAEGRHHA